MSGFLESLYFYCRNESPTNSSAEIKAKKNTPELDKLYNDFKKAAGIETCEMEDMLFDVVFTHACEYELHGFEEGFKFGMKMAAAIWAG